MISEYCIRFDHDREFCSIFDYVYDIDKICFNCHKFLYINWKVIEGTQKQKRELWKRIRND